MIFIKIQKYRNPNVYKLKIISVERVKFKVVNVCGSENLIVLIGESNLLTLPQITILLSTAPPPTYSKGLVNYIVPSTIILLKLFPEY